MIVAHMHARERMYATSVGKAYLAALPEEHARETLETLDMRGRTRNTITDPNALYAEVQKTRREATPYDNEENEPTYAASAAPFSTGLEIPLARSASAFRSIVSTRSGQRTTSSA